MPKRYFVTNTSTTELPIEFTSAQTKKYIHVLGVRLISKTTGGLIMNATAHGDFVIDHPYLNNFICFCNEQLPKRKKWEIQHRPQRISLRFQESDGTPLNPIDYEFIAELMLEY